MAKKNQTPKTSTSPRVSNVSTRKPNPLEGNGYTSVDEERTDLDGYWIPERGPLHGKLISAFQFIQKSGKSRGKTQTVFVFDLADPCIALVKVEGGGKDEAELEPRSLCGVLASYGLRSLVNLGGCFVKLERQPTKRMLGNGNEMWAYNMACKPARGRTLDIRPPLVSGQNSNGMGMREPGDDSDEPQTTDELPF